MSDTEAWLLGKYVHIRTYLTWLITVNPKSNSFWDVLFYFAKEKRKFQSVKWLDGGAPLISTRGGIQPPSLRATWPQNQTSLHWTTSLVSFAHLSTLYGSWTKQELHFTLPQLGRGVLSDPNSPPPWAGPKIRVRGSRVLIWRLQINFSR